MASPIQFAFRTSKGLGITDAAPVYEALPGFQRPEGNFRCCDYSPDGRYFAWASPESVTIVDASVGYVVRSINAENVFELGFSPLGTFIITWQRPTKDEKGDAVKNLIVWRVRQDDDQPPEERQETFVARFVQKSQTGWNLQYTQDEQHCARMVTNEVQFYQSHDLSTVWNKLRVEGVQDFALSPGQTNAVAVFVPERKGQPAAIKTFVVPNFTTPVSQKTFFKADKVQFKWNAQGSSLLVLAQTEVDKAGKSYYGEQTLYLLSAAGGFDSRVELDKEGPIYDASWSPSSKEFGVVYGSMPAKTTIFNSKGVAVHNFTLGPRNTINFSPIGRFVLVAGFGALTGDVDIYDLEKNYKKICTIQASNASVCSWSPDGQYLMTAITSPRLRVDNGVRLWHVSGGLMYNEDMHELYHIGWRPQPGSPQLSSDPLVTIPTPHASALAYLGTVKTPSKPMGAYRPPGARGTSTPLAFMREDQGGAAFVSNGSISLGGGGAASFGRPRRSVPGADIAEESVPGAAPADGDDSLSKTAMKNKKKREAKKAKDSVQQDGEGQLFGANGGPGHYGHNRSPERPDRRGPRPRANSEFRPRSQNRSRNPSQRRESYTPRSGGHRANGHASHNKQAHPAHPAHQAHQAHQAHHNPPQPAPIATSLPPAAVASPTNNGDGATEPTTPGATGAGTPTAQEKKVRALTKKLRAIDDLKMRSAAGEKLEGTQVKKMETEESVRKELEALGWTDG